MARQDDGQASAGGGFGYSLSKTTQLWRGEVGEALRPWGVTVPQFLVLMELYRPARHGWPAPQQSSVAARLGMDANTTSQIVRGLESRGVLVRASHPTDRRARVLSLTDAGLGLARVTSAAARSTNDQFFGVLSPENREVLGALLDSLTAQSRTRNEQKEDES